MYVECKTTKCGRLHNFYFVIYNIALKRYQSIKYILQLCILDNDK